MVTDQETLKSLMQQGLLPQEEMLEVRKKKGSLIIGIPREHSFQEHRVALVPEAVSVLVANGHEVRVESKAGANSNFSDREYSEVGAQIVFDRKQIFECSIILKVAPILDEELENLVQSAARPRIKQLILKTLDEESKNILKRPIAA